MCVRACVCFIHCWAHLQYTLRVFVILAAYKLWERIPSFMLCEFCWRSSSAISFRTPHSFLEHILICFCFDPILFLLAAMASPASFSSFSFHPFFSPPPPLWLLLAPIFSSHTVEDRSSRNISHIHAWLLYALPFHACIKNPTHLSGVQLFFFAHSVVRLP